ncbi:transglutaminase family protein, partial [Acinetobacter baumannii]
MTLTSLDYFASLVRQDDSIPLFESALTLGQDFYPEMDFAEEEMALDTLALKLRQRLPQDASQIQKLRMLNHFFFQEMAFAG